jgi:hypothetical protein
VQNSETSTRDPLSEILAESAIRRIAAAHYSDQGRIAALVGCLSTLIRSAERQARLRDASGDLIDPSYPSDTESRVAAQERAASLIRENRAALLQAAELSEADLDSTFRSAGGGQTRLAHLLRRRGWLYCALDLALGAGPAAIKNGLGDPRDHSTIINAINRHRELLPSSRVALDDFLVVLRRVKAIIPHPAQ